MFSNTVQSGALNLSTSSDPFDLDRFHPYQLAVLADTVSRSIAQVYATRFDLTRDEWRVLAALAQRGAMKTAEVIAHTTLEKMQVSRAVARLLAAGHISRSADSTDRRQYVLRLTAGGQALMRKLVPMVLAREAFLLEALDEHERAVLDGAYAKLRRRARQLLDQG